MSDTLWGFIFEPGKGGGGDASFDNLVLTNDLCFLFTNNLDVVVNNG